jgi:hypothetical protein
LFARIGPFGIQVHFIDQFKVFAFIIFQPSFGIVAIDFLSVDPIRLGVGRKRPIALLLFSAN